MPLSVSALIAFSEFVELVARIAVVGLQQENYHIIFPTPFSKVNKSDHASCIMHHAVLCPLASNVHKCVQ